MRPSAPFLSAPLACFLCLLLSGCSLSSTSAPTPDPGLAIQGKVQGGNQPITGAHVYLFAANTAGNAGPGIAASTNNKSLSLLTTGSSDSVGTYVTTDTNGNFSISSDYSCTLNTQVYVYALDGNPGLATGTNNTSAGLLAVLGNCPSALNFQTATPFIYVNEVSTIAAAYAFAGYATDATHVSSSGTVLAKTGIANAFLNAGNLEKLATGVALATTPAGNGTVPQTEINSLADTLAACVNTTGTVSGPTNPTPCYTLFTNALSGGTTGAQPTDTATAAINIAHNPSANITQLYALATASPPFTGLSAQPNDFTVGISFSGGGLNSPYAIAIDSTGNAWVTNIPGATGGVISEFSSLGASLLGTSGFSATSVEDPEAIAIDTSGNVWVANSFGNDIAKLSSAASLLSGTSGYTSGGVDFPIGLALDGSANVWAIDDDNVVTELTNAGSPISTSGYSGGALNSPIEIAIDGSGNAWMPNTQGNNVTEISPSGSFLSGVNGYTNGGLNFPAGVAIDSAGNAWIPDLEGNSVTVLSNSDSAVSGATGYSGGGLSGPDFIALDGSGNAWITNRMNSVNSISEISHAGIALSPSNGFRAGGLASPYQIAVDGSGDVWVTNSFTTITEFIGAATPVITPLAAGLPVTPTANGTSNLGTRP
jgi:hypothetical protein